MQCLYTPTRSLMRTRIIRNCVQRRLLQKCRLCPPSSALSLVSTARGFQSTRKLSLAASTTSRRAVTVRRTKRPLYPTATTSNRKSNKSRFSSQAVMNATTNESSSHLASAATTASTSSSRSSGFGSSYVSANHQPAHLSWQGARALFVASAVPMVGFGFMDNLVMIQAGQYIDSTLGVKLGLATMTAAACGQVVSDVSGVLFGGTVEAFINRWMPNYMAASLSLAQRQSTWGRYASLAGAVIGVTIGCTLGALTLFFVDLEARDRIQRAGHFKEVLTDMTQASNANMTFPCRGVVVHLAVKANQKYDWQSINQQGGEDGQAPHVRMQSLTLQDENAADDLVTKAAHQQEILVRGQRLYAPILQWEKEKQDEIWAVVELEKEGDEAVSESDIKKVELMASHLSIFMQRMAD